VAAEGERENRGGDGDGGREFRVFGNSRRPVRESEGGDGGGVGYDVVELMPGGPVVRLAGLLRWQALAVVAVLDPPFRE
jgi:hypothetical protein